MDNEKERLIKAIEQINNEKKDILASKEYRLGNNIVQYIQHFKPKKMIKFITTKRRNRIEKKRLYQHEPQSIYNILNKEVKSVEDKKIVVYTCVTGNYDKVLEPLYHNDNVDYIIYTNCQNIELKTWKRLEIPDNIKQLNNNVLINRYIKMHPREFFENEYDYAIYIDGNIQTISDISDFICKTKSETGLALHRHYVRDCIYWEEKACELYKKGDIKKLRDQVNKYKKEGMPENYGLLECNVIVSNLKSDIAEKILDNWWEEFVESKSMRDQISLPYVLWKMNYKMADIGNLGNNVYVNSKISINNHK